MATFDPTTLVNGNYQILIAVESSGGGTRTSVSSVCVRGDMKLGDYQTTFLDMETTISGVPVQVFRTYDTTDKRLGDFGLGWRVSLSSYRATPNSKLGQGGWSTEPFGFPFTRFRFRLDRPALRHGHLAGRPYRGIDLVPAPSGPLLSPPPRSSSRGPVRARRRSSRTPCLPPTLSLAGIARRLLRRTIYRPDAFKSTTKDGVVLSIDRFGGPKSRPTASAQAILLVSVTPPSTDRHLTLCDGAGRITETVAEWEAHAVHLLGAATSQLHGREWRRRRVHVHGSHRLLRIEVPGDTRVWT